MKELPDVHFGRVGGPHVPLPPVIDTPDDDEPLAVTPPDVVALLGFDPLLEDDFDGLLSEHVDPDQPPK